MPPAAPARRAVLAARACGKRLLSFCRDLMLKGGGLELRVAEVPVQEGEVVAPVGDLLVDGVGESVARVVVDAKEDRFSAAGVGLEAGGHFGSLPRGDAGIVCARRDQ